MKTINLFRFFRWQVVYFKNYETTEFGIMVRPFMKK